MTSKLNLLTSIALYDMLLVWLITMTLSFPRKLYQMLNTQRRIALPLLVLNFGWCVLTAWISNLSC